MLSFVRIKVLSSIQKCNVPLTIDYSWQREVEYQINSFLYVFFKLVFAVFIRVSYFFLPQLL